MKDPISGIGQGNSFSGELYKAKSCWIIKELETDELGITIKSLITEVLE